MSRLLVTLARKGTFDVGYHRLERTVFYVILEQLALFSIVEMIDDHHIFIALSLQYECDNVVRTMKRCLVG
jgi:hypothetical protein